jgi:NADPH:quinone reductase-like Zn-dependent oxidoreductase
VNDSYGWPQLPQQNLCRRRGHLHQGDQVMGKAAPGYRTYAEHAVLLGSPRIAKPPQLSLAAAAVVPVAGATA